MKSGLLVLFIAATSLSFRLCAVEPVRIWTNPDERNLEARILSSTAESATVLTSTGRGCVIPFSKLGEDDVNDVKGKKRSRFGYGGQKPEDFPAMLEKKLPAG